MAKQDKKPKLLFGQNMSARVRSPLFWTGIVGILGSAVVSFGNLIGVDFTGTVSSVTESADGIINFVFLVLGLIGVTNNPTTKRYRDTGIEQEFTKPRDDTNPSEFVQWQENVDKENSSLREENEQLRKQKEEEQREIKEAMNNDSDEEGELLAPERKAKDVEEFDTSQPFTDDSDEVEFDVADYEDEREVALGESNFHDDSELKDGKEDESEKADFVENIDDIDTSDNVGSNKEDIDKVVKKKITKEVIEDKKESDK